MTVTRALLKRLSREPLYGSVTAEMVTTLDGRTPTPYASPFRRIIKSRWKPKSRETALKAALGRALLGENLIGEYRTRYALTSIQEWWVRAEMFATLTPQFFGSVFLENALNDGLQDAVSDAALSAAERLSILRLNVKTPLRGINRSAARVLRNLRLISRLPRGIDGVELSLSRILGSRTGLNWRSIFGRDYKHAERQAVFCRALADTNPTAFVNAADVFNDLLLYRLYRHDPALGLYVLGNIGSILTSARLRRGYPNVFALVSDVHDKRYISSLSHAKARRTGKPTGRIKYEYLNNARRLLRRAFTELAARW